VGLVPPAAHSERPLGLGWAGLRSPRSCLRWTRHWSKEPAWSCLCAGCWRTHQFPMPVRRPSLMSITCTNAI